MLSQPGWVRLQSESGKQIDRACGHVRHDGGPRALAIPRVLRDAGFGKNRSSVLRLSPRHAGSMVQKIVPAKAVLFTSENESRLAKDTFLPEARYRGRILPLGVERNPAVPDRLRELFFKEFPHLRDRRFLLFLGRLHPKKGCDLLIKAMARIRPPIDLVFAGPISNKEYVCKLKRSAEELPIVFAGMLHGDIKSGALAAAEALILPSHQENFGLVVAEALSFGTPALISDQVGVAEDVISWGAGFVEPDTLMGTERLIERWLQEGTLAMRTSALNCFQNRFDIKHSAIELMRILSGDG
jgi:glycosyltransferase involved in cell wall biosynthesis